MIWLTIGTWIVTAACLVGTALNVKKIKYCFHIWAVANLLWLAYDLYTGLYSRAVLDAVQFVMAVWGIFAWRKKKE